LASPKTRRCRAFSHSALPLLRPKDRVRQNQLEFASATLFLLAGNRSRRTLARARIGVRPLTPDRQAPPVAQAAIAAEFQQALYVPRHGAAQVALDRVFAVDQLAPPQHLVVGHFMDPALDRDADPSADFHSLGPTDAVDIRQTDRNPLLIGDVDASDSRHCA